ncbi:serine/threonine protein kinase [Aspergillus avenaceus]|uniref:Serine/threonine protein kinase n=1 Tax=Aspergillus avenaceus TaxID=36643 RepID=A0A5N6TL23_ASPAV|nr:serine/threonine protein kinase [Aspergillus avenaceus]
MNTLLKVGQSLQGRRSMYNVTKQLHKSVWLARNDTGKPVLVKCTHQARITNERNVLKEFQSQTNCLRRLVDEIEEPANPPAIVLQHLDDDLSNASATQRLTTTEIKYVSKRILQALAVLHERGYVHTDVKLDNVLVNYGSISDGNRFTDVQLADLGNTVHVESKFCQDRDLIGAPLWRSPEAQLGLQWGPATDLWSFGTLVISLIWGKNFFIFKPNVPLEHDEYVLKILAKYHVYFGPYPPSYSDLADDETLAILSYIMDSVSPTDLRPFTNASKKEISTDDKEFILRIMKLDPRDRPTAKELLDDEWFNS